MNNYSIFVQARMSSTRSPGKVMTNIVDKPMLLRQLERLRHKCQDLPIVCVTSKDHTDDPIEELCQKYGFLCYRGSLENVLDRYINAAIEFDVDYIIRVGGDDPLIDPNACLSVLREHKSEEAYDFVYTSHRKGWPYGCACELISVSTLKDIMNKTNDPLYLEHIIPYFWDHPNEYKILKLNSPESICKPDYYFSVDYEEDIELLRQIFLALLPKGENFSLEKVLEFCERNPQLLKINQHLHSGFDH
jgi:spore coat polysaccharide biosynthesis protein SpsF